MKKIAILICSVILALGFVLNVSALDITVPSSNLWKRVGTVISPSNDSHSLSVADMVVTGNVTGDLSLQDDNKIYFDTAEAESLEYSSTHGCILLNSAIGYVGSIAEFGIYSNTAADAAGNWEPAILLKTNGEVEITNTAQGDAASRRLAVDMVGGLYLKAGTQPVTMKTTNLTTNRDVEFPNIAGTLVTTAGAVADVNLGDGYKLITDEVRAYDAAGLKLYDDGGNGIFVEDGGNVGIGVAGPASILDIDKGTGYGQVTLNGSSGGCLMLRDTDDAGWTECSALNGTLTCTVDADGICDGS